ncbi:MAG: ABC transporter permease [Jatrophihabitans sp.]
MTSATATGPLLQLALRRDRLMIPIWLYALVASVASTAWSYRTLYDTPAERRTFAESAEANSATRALYGHVYAPDSVGGLTAWRMVALGGALLVVFTVLLVVRHSRAEEQAGRIELLSAAVVGRAAPLVAAVVTALIAVAAIAVVVAGALVLLGLPVAGSLAFGAAWLGLGAVFAGVASVTAQLTESARAARGIAMAVAAGGFTIRVVADGSVTWLTWCTPFGWAQQVRPFGGNRWWVLILPALSAALLLSAGFAVHTRRDLGAGLLPPRPGPPRARRRLRSAMSLTVRLGRGSLLAWFVGLCLYGVVIGAIASSVSQFTNGSRSTEDLLTKLGGRGGLVDAFLGTSLGLCGLAAAAYGITVMLRARDEETSVRLEAVLATRVGRLRWLGGQLAFALAGTTMLVLGAGVAAGLLHGLRTHQFGHQLGRVVAATAVQLPAVWLITALAAVLVGCLPRATQAGWALVGLCGLISLIGPVVNAGQWVLDVSPFSHLPATPGAAVSVAAVVWTIGLTCVAILVALAGFRHRDIG